MISDRLKHEILEQPERAISFRRYMEIILYDPQYGYYSREKEKIGKRGDFYTNANVGAVFGDCLADRFASLLANIEADRLQLVELGAGTGELARRILIGMRERHPEIYRRLDYLIVESSAYHRKRQKEVLRDAAARVSQFASLRDAQRAFPKISGIAFGNEFADALPVHIVEKGERGWLEIKVTWSEEDQCVREKRFPLRNRDVKRYIEREAIDVPAGYRFEVNLEVEKWIASLAAWAARAYLLLIDYGYLKEEWFVPQHKNGTLMCYREHRADDDPYEAPGEKDVTAHVPFFSLIHAGEANGWKKEGYWTQADFLLQSGILDKLKPTADRDPFRSPEIKQNLAIRQLIMPGGMGETFKVLLLSKGIENVKGTRG